MAPFFGDYGLVVHLAEGDLSLSISEEDGQLWYHRNLRGDRYDTIIAASGGSVTINPVEPLNLPSRITGFLEIQFDPLIIEPEKKETIYLTFPLEIGVFIYSRRDLEVLDIFSLNRPKYSLYGSPKDGVITRIHTCHVSASPPVIDPWREGVLDLTIRNTTDEWVRVSRAVFDGYGMKIYYDDKGATMLATMKILDRMSAETSFYDMPLRDGMKRSIEIYHTRHIPVMKRVFTMEQGLVR
ncbi:MAG: DUF432 domain-containing protein [Methanoculleaceae archaeon]